MKKVLFIIFAELLIGHEPCFSTNLTTNVNTPFSSGMITVKNIQFRPAKYEYDSLSFSNGIILPFFSQTSNIPEPPTLFNGLKVDSTDDLLETGFRKTFSASWKNENTIPYYSNGDTTWSTSDMFPDSLIHLDSLWNNNPPDTVRLARGKWLWSSGPSNLLWYNAAATIPGYNTIIYFKTKSNSMKLQVFAIMFSIDTIGTKYYINVDSIAMKWAVDSLGNGKFKQFTPIKNRGTTPTKPAINKNYRFNSIESLFHV